LSRNERKQKKKNGQNCPGMNENKRRKWTKLSRNERKQKKKNGQNCPGMNESKRRKMDKIVQE
jgi:hypothetical protein